MKFGQPPGQGDLMQRPATLLVQQGVPVRVVMDLLGHTQLSQTVATYQHTPAELAADAAERIARALWRQAA